VSLSVACPGVAVGFAAGIAGINLALPDIQARLDALAAFAPQVEISFAANIAVAQSIAASLQAAISAGLSPPSLSAQIAIVAALVAALEIAVGQINAQLTVLIDLSALLDAAGVFLYSYSGRSDGLGPALDTELSTGFPGGTAGQQCNALVLATTTPGTWDAMSELFKVS
jgi:hypothetical protein